MVGGTACLNAPAFKDAPHAMFINLSGECPEKPGSVDVHTRATLEGHSDTTTWKCPGEACAHCKHKEVPVAERGMCACAVAPATARLFVPCPCLKHLFTIVFGWGAFFWWWWWWGGADTLSPHVRWDRAPTQSLTAS